MSKILAFNKHNHLVRYSCSLPSTKEIHGLKLALNFRIMIVSHFVHIFLFLRLSIPGLFFYILVF